MGGRIRAECHLLRCNYLGIRRKWEYSEEWCTWWRGKDRERHRRMCTRKTDYCHIWHGSSKITDMTWTSRGQCSGFQTRMRSGWSILTLKIFKAHIVNIVSTVKSSREIEKAKTWYFLWSSGSRITMLPHASHSAACSTWASHSRKEVVGSIYASVHWVALLFSDKRVKAYSNNRLLSSSTSCDTVNQENVAEMSIMGAAAYSFCVLWSILCKVSASETEWLVLLYLTIRRVI